MPSLRYCSTLIAAAVFFACASNDGDAGSSPHDGGGGAALAAAGAAVSGHTGAVSPSTSGSGATPGAGTSSQGGSAGSPATTGGTAGASPQACGSGGQSNGFEEDCRACAADSCELCLCSDCTEQLQECAATPGCAEILACARQSQCLGAACYCGDFSAVACANGQANGPCKSAMLQAPGGRTPTLIDSSAGPASDAAAAISACADTGRPCALACSSK